MPDQPKLVGMYAEMMFMDFGHEFTSEKLSKLMVATTAPIVGWGINISSWRHINIAFKRKLCQTSFDIAEQTASSAVFARLNGHSPETENRIYGVSADAMLGTSEDVFQLYLDASTEWQKAFRIVPGGLGLPYKKVRSKMFDNLVEQDTITWKHKSKVATETPGPIGDNYTLNMLRDMRKNSAKTEALILAQQTEMVTQLKGLTQQLAQMQEELTKLRHGSFTPNVNETDPFDMPLEYANSGMSISCQYMVLLTFNY